MTFPVFVILSFRKERKYSYLYENFMLVVYVRSGLIEGIRTLIYIYIYIYVESYHKGKKIFKS